ncbi:M14 family zinc carboxypeptidase [Hugenholtzia roseola]|uniref:M14 family zinc carboxypeptidase n=1 Tax=Hugenholtzia roseola TaxID=1002 RepID=UPI0004067664|nr:M14 family zinc carboxypeptidase [Hugenholtzia roseola]
MTTQNPTTSFANFLAEYYAFFRYENLLRYRFKMADFYTALQATTTSLESSLLGHSWQGRPIFKVQVGKGKKKVLLWSQMHGNEPTATLALLDIFNFFNGSFSYPNPFVANMARQIREKIEKNLHLIFVPVLNPDGTERFTRVTAQGIDMNRDFRQRQTPEGRLLIALAADFQPEFSFNLHDQRSKYSVGDSANPTTMAFLAPAPDAEKSLTPRRKAAIQLISLMVKTLEPYIGQNLAKYNDDFEPRAFGDNFQSLGYGTILIESGHVSGDFEKQQVRKYNFIAILTALYALASDLETQESLEPYEALPFNGERFFDLILRKVEIFPNCTVDVAIERDAFFQKNDTNGKPLYDFVGKIATLGDLTGFYGHQEVDCSGLKVVLQKGEWLPEASPLVFFYRKDGQLAHLLAEGNFLTCS